MVHPNATCDNILGLFETATFTRNSSDSYYSFGWLVTLFMGFLLSAVDFLPFLRLVLKIPKKMAQPLSCDTTSNLLEAFPKWFCLANRELQAYWPRCLEFLA